MNYSDLIATLQNLLVIPIGNTDFAQILPLLIADGENRIYRELDFLITQASDSNNSFTPNVRVINFPTGMIIINSLNAITPDSTAPDAGTRYPLMRVSLDYLNNIWPQATGSGASGVPQFYAINTDLNLFQVIVAPTPDSSYRAEFTGIFRPAPISSSNTTTWLSINLPDLLVAACMVPAAGWQQNYGASGADNPQMPGTWEGHYQALKQGAIEEEQRRKSQGMGWGPFSQTPLASPPRSA